MNNDIINFLNIEDKNVETIKISIEGNVKQIHLRKVLRNEYCPVCQTKMHSRGIYKRKINHPVLQDGYSLEIVLHQRKWRCTNPQCNHYMNDQFNFVEPSKQSSNVVPFLILKEMKDINITTTEVAKRFNVSDTFVHYIFMQYLDIKRLPLPEILSIDEVHLDIDSYHNYALVMMDFVSGEIIDILPNRWEETTNAYFLSIPLKERKKVKYLICDMYDPYINYTNRYFPNSVAVIDSFHVISWLIKNINSYINNLKKKFQARDQKRHAEKLKKENKYRDEETTKASTPISYEVYLLINFRWFVLKNKEDIEYNEEGRYNKKFKAYLTTRQLESMFFDIDPTLKIIRDLKEEYIEFNSTDERDITKIEAELDRLIFKYNKSSFNLFKEFAKLLKSKKEEILNSFTFIIGPDGKERRLSNGPMEGYNRTPKDYKRNSRGLNNYEYTRARLIWANRDNEPILAIPKSKEEVYKKISKKKEK